MKTPYKMYGKSPMMKALIGKQNNLPEELKAKIIASPAKTYGKGKNPIMKKEKPMSAKMKAKVAAVKKENLIQTNKLLNEQGKASVKIIKD